MSDSHTGTVLGGGRRARGNRHAGFAKSSVFAGLLRQSIMVATMVLSSVSVWAQQDHPFGVGVILDAPSGLTAKYMMNRNSAIDIGLGFSSDFTLHADYVWHMWDVFSQPPSGKLAFYLAVGPRVEEQRVDNKFGIRTIAGVDYWLDKHPFEFFLELGPVFEFAPDTGTDFDAGIGLRYYFGRPR